MRLTLSPIINDQRSALYNIIDPDDHEHMTRSSHGGSSAQRLSLIVLAAFNIKYVMLGSRTFDLRRGSAGPSNTHPKLQSYTCQCGVGTR